jgi:hypothetical protein
VTAKQIVRHLAEPEEKKGLTDFIRERPLDVTYRRMVRKALNNVRTRKAKKQ